MEFEQLKATWRKQSSEEPAPAPTGSPAGNLRKNAWQHFWTHLFQNEKELVTGLLIAACSLIGLLLVKSFLIKAGLGITAMVFFLALTWFSILRMVFRPARTNLPTRAFLIQDRARMDSWIRMLRWFLWVYFAIAFWLVAIYDYAFWMSGQHSYAFVLLGYYVFLVGIIQVTMVRRLRRNYLHGRDAIEQFLRELTDKDL